MTPDELKQRSKRFALRVMKLVEALPHSTSGQVLGRQLLRAATSVAANYRAACRARSHAEFIAKLGIVEEEADECVFWLEMIEESQLVPASRLTELTREASELTAIMVSSIRSARKRASANPQSAIRNPQSPASS